MKPDKKTVDRKNKGLDQKEGVPRLTGWHRLHVWIMETFFSHFTFESGGKVKKVRNIGLWSFLFQFLYYLRYRAYGNAFCNIMLFLVALLPYYLFNHILNPIWILPYAGTIWSAYLLLRNMYMTIKMSEKTVHAYYCYKKGYIVTG